MERKFFTWGYASRNRRTSADGLIARYGEQRTTAFLRLAAPGDPRNARYGLRRIESNLNATGAGVIKSFVA